MDCLLFYSETYVETSFFFFSSRRRHTSFKCDWSSDVCSSDLVDGARDELLAGAGLAEDAHARFARGHAIDLRHDAAHRVALPDDLVTAHAPPQLPVLLLQTRQPERILDREQQLVRRDRLLEEVDGAQAR